MTTPAGDDEADPPRPSGGFRVVAPGAALGRYELIEELGEGGMATVYRARDTELRRDVAIKILFPHLAKRAEIVRRFDREARAAAALEHPNILRVYDVGGGTAAGAGAGGDPPYIVMELVRGATLKDAIDKHGPLLAELAACAGALLADALAAAHAAGVIHRDVKPANAMVASDGRLLLADFGVARVEDDDSLVTRTGALLGTPAFMSPEQATGADVDPRTDVYSLGATLYQLATGSPPYTGAAARVVAAIAAGELVAPVRRRPAIGGELSRQIERMMATDPARRPATAAAAAVELRALVAAAGLGDPADELAAYFADPPAYLAAKTPVVVKSLADRARAARDGGNLPRAIALVDRASALAPGDPAITTLVEQLATRRPAPRWLVLAGLGSVGVAAAAAYGLFAARGATDILVDAAGLDAAAAPAVVVDARAIDAAAAPPVPPVPIVDAAAAPIADRRPDARTRIAAGAADARIAVASTPPVDAAVAVAPPPPPDAAGPATRTAISIAMDSWCDLTIDGEARGRLAGKRRTYDVAPGDHALVCQKGSTGIAWRQTVHVDAGQTVAVAGALLTKVIVTIATRGKVTIDATSYAPGDKVTLVSTSHRVEADGKAFHLPFPRAATCTLRDTGDPERPVDCFPPP